MAEDLFEGQGRIGLHLETPNVAVSPGGSVSVILIVANRGLEPDQFRLAVKGIPVAWISTASPVIPLNPGQQQEVTITVNPPRSTQSRAGRHALSIRILSQAVPDQMVEAECVLTIGVFDQFQGELRPQRVEAGEPVRLTIENQGNTPQAYSVIWQSLEDQLVFEPGQTQDVRVPEGEVTMLEFHASPRQRPLFGGERSYAYTARVQSPAGDAKNLGGEVISSGMVPSWVLPVFLVLIMAAACVAALLLFGGGGDADLQPTSPPVAQATDTVQAPAPTDVPPTEVPPTEAPPEPTEPPLEPTDQPPPEPTDEPPPEPTDEGGEGTGPDIPCLPLAGLLLLAPLLIKRQRTD